MVDPLYSIEKLCRTLQGLTARFYSGALCYQRLVNQIMAIEWRSQPPRVVPRGIIYIYRNEDWIVVTVIQDFGETLESVHFDDLGDC